MPTDMEIRTSVGCLASYALWTAALLFLIAGTALDSFTVQNWGLVMSAAAATCTIRQYFVRQNRIMRNAFELARDAATVAPLRPR